MRLSETQTRHIMQATREIAGPEATVRLFGPRLDDHQRGGDIDLLVQCNTPQAKPVVLVAQLTARLQHLPGDRKIDVLVLAHGMALEPVHRVGLSEGRVLRTATSCTRASGCHKDANDQASRLENRSKKLTSHDVSAPIATKTSLVGCATVQLNNCEKDAPSHHHICERVATFANEMKFNTKDKRPKREECISPLEQTNLPQHQKVTDLGGGATPSNGLEATHPCWPQASLQR